MVIKRVNDEPGYVLHRYDWSESSLILDVFTRRYGRVALVAKGAKRPSSNFRPVLLPLQALRVSFGGDAEIRTLRGAEWAGGHVMPTGDALLSGYYLNELLLRLLARDDPHEDLFDAYALAVQVLASEHGEALPATLRSFEGLLLRDTGVLPPLDVQTMPLEPLAGKTTVTLWHRRQRRYKRASKPPTSAPACRVRNVPESSSKPPKKPHGSCISA